MSIRYVHDHSLGRELERHPGLVDEFRDRAEAIAEEARRTAPVDTGEYLASIQAEAGLDTKVRGRVFSDDPKAPYLEYGTIDTPVFGTLRNAADRAIGH